LGTTRGADQNLHFPRAGIVVTLVDPTERDRNVRSPHLSPVIASQGPMQGFFEASGSQRVVWYAALATALVVASIVASFVMPPLVSLLREFQLAVEAGRARVLSWADGVVARRIAQFWAGLRHEPREPVLARLERLDDAARQLGDRQMSWLERLDTQLRDNLAVLRAASMPNPLPKDSDQHRIARAIAGGPFGAIVGLWFLAIALGGINSFLLSVFFREVLPSGRLLPYPLPDVQAGNILAIIFFIAELSSGWMIYRNSPPRADTVGQPRNARSSTEVVFHAFPWIVLVVLTMIETAAYALLSVQIGLPRLLGIPQTNAFFGVTQYFFAAFGFAITGGVASIGHALADAHRKWRESRVERRILVALKKRDKDVMNAVDRVRNSVAQIREAAAQIPDSIAREFADVVGVDRATYPGAPLALYEGIVLTLESPDPGNQQALPYPSASPRPPFVRARAQVVADLGLNIVIAIVLAVVGALTTLEVASWIYNQNLSFGAAFAWAGGIAIPAAVIGIGVLLRNSLASLGYASIVEESLASPKGRRLYGGGLLALVSASAILLGWLAATTAVLGPVLALNCLLGVFQAAVLVAFGAFLDSAIVAVWNVTYLAIVLSIALAAHIVAILAVIVAGIFWLGQMVVRLVAIPGNLLRGLRGEASEAEIGKA
jgi:hypothetical protein